MDPITQALVLLALKEAPVVVMAAIDMVNSIKAGEPTETAILTYLAIQHPDAAAMLAAAKAKLAAPTVPAQSGAS